MKPILQNREADSGIQTSRYQRLKARHENLRQQTGKSVAFIAYFAIVLCLLFYFANYPIEESDSWLIVMALDMIPDIIVIIISAMLFRYFYQQPGLSWQRDVDDSLVEIAELLEMNALQHDSLPTALINEMSDLLGLQQSTIIAAFDSFKEMNNKDSKYNWEFFFTNGKSIVSVVFYVDSWIDQHAHLIYEFLKRPRSNLEVYTLNPDNTDVLGIIRDRHFPQDTDLASLKGKIERTKTKLEYHYQRICSESIDDETKSSNLSTLLVGAHNKVMSYSFHVVDDRYLILLIWPGLDNHSPIEGPAIIIDLQKSSEWRRRCESEIDSIRIQSKRIELSRQISFE